MELKINYQYTYFIQPFIINDRKYKNYILKMIKDKNFKLKSFQKEKDLRIYKYFLPKAREIFCNNFELNNTKLKELKELPIDTQAAILSKYECNIFEYNLKDNIQGKVDSEGKKGIFFNIQKIEIVCFNTGICFLVIKTDVEENTKFSNILNFNYKFRDINNNVSISDKSDNIRLQTNSFEDVEDFQEFVKRITGDNLEARKLDIDTERFFTYSYICIDQESWNSEESFENIKEQFVKYTNILPADSSKKYSYDELQIFSKWKYSKIGITKQSVNLFSSTNDINNYTILPEEFENQYLYTTIINLYKKIYLKKIRKYLNSIDKIKKGRKEFIEFSKKLWISEITDNESGNLLNEELHSKFELDKLYKNVKEKYELLYKEYNIVKSRKTLGIIAGILGITLVVNLINLLLY